MTLLKKGTNVLQRLTGSSYLLEINKLSEQFSDVMIILDNNHQIDALYNELKSFYKNKKIIQSGENKQIRNYGIGAQIIKDLKIRKMILITKSPKKVIGLEGFDIKITKQELI